MLRNLQSRWNRYRVRSVLGWRGTLEYLIQLNRNSAPGSTFRLHTRSALHPVVVRRHSSDINAFDQIFVRRQYKCLDELVDVRLVVDCGANVGYSSAYFLSAHPNSRIIAIEPNPNNFEILRLNLLPYRDRAT